MSRLVIGRRTPQGAEVVLSTDGIERPLPPRLDLYDHSPTGLEWGYGGSGPAQLALAILAQVMDENSARLLYQKYKWDVISRLPHDGWELSLDDVCRWARSLTPPQKAR